jgi:hypothetical protein
MTKTVRWNRRIALLGMTLAAGVIALVALAGVWATYQSGAGRPRRDRSDHDLR